MLWQKRPWAQGQWEDRMQCYFVYIVLGYFVLRGLTWEDITNYCSTVSPALSAGSAGSKFHFLTFCVPLKELLKQRNEVMAAFGQFFSWFVQISETELCSFLPACTSFPLVEGQRVAQHAHKHRWAHVWAVGGRSEQPWGRWCRGENGFLLPRQDFVMWVKLNMYKMIFLGWVG